MATEDNNQHEELIKEFDRYDNLHTKNLINQDATLVQISGVLLAVIATLGKEVLKANKTLGYLIIILLGLTIVQVVLGYFFSNRFFMFVKDKLNQNYENRVTPVTKDVDTSIEGKINDFFNTSQFVTFLLGIILFTVLIIIYIGGI